VIDLRLTLLIRGFTKEKNKQVFLFSRKKKYIQKRGLAITAFDGSLGSDGPALLTATTRNSYSFPSDKPPQAPLFC
jgi:hypothetical protein